MPHSPLSKWLSNHFVRRGNKLTLAPWQDPMDDANLALSGAFYHYDEIGKLLGVGPSNRDGPLSSKRKIDRYTRGRLHWHFRGFFWELVAARDCLRASARYREYANGLDSKEWFQQVNEYRNHLHRSTYMLQVIASGNGVTLRLQSLSPGTKDGQHGPDVNALGLLHSYLVNMHAFLKRAPTKQQEP